MAPPLIRFLALVDLGSHATRDDARLEAATWIPPSRLLAVLSELDYDAGREERQAAARDRRLRYPPPGEEDLG